MGGENETAEGIEIEARGSSPRGRGKRVPKARLIHQPGLIPAWAGKTPRRSGATRTWPAHPRVGGENVPVPWASPQMSGSSPRGRGKRAAMVTPRPKGGLIPAWAGKTPRPTRQVSPRSAHPRVGGENVRDLGNEGECVGSSPRGRGKRNLHRRDHGPDRLIPAWAGKTLRTILWPRIPGAHPRVGGENSRPDRVHSPSRGSSPRGRGKRIHLCIGVCMAGLIPAWAGKT